MVQEGVTQWCGVLLRWSGSIFRYRGASALWEGWQPIKMEENQLNWVTYGGLSLSLSLYLSFHTPPTMGNPVKKQFCYKGMVSGRDKVSVCVFFPHAFGYRDARTNRTRCDVSDQIHLACFDIVVCHTDQVKGDMCCISTYDDQRNLVTSN